MLPPTPPAPPLVLPSPPATVELQVVKGPPAMAELAAGTRMSGRVVAAGAAGSTTIQTELGEIAVKASHPLAKGAAITLVVQSPAPRLVVRAAPMPSSMTGGSAPAAGAASPAPDAGRAVPAPSLPPGAVIGRTVTAVVAHSLPASAPPPSSSATPVSGLGQAPWQAGTRLTLRIIGVGSMADAKGAGLSAASASASSGPGAAQRFDGRITGNGAMIRLPGASSRLLVMGRAGDGAAGHGIGRVADGTVLTFEVAKAVPAEAAGAPSASASGPGSGTGSTGGPAAGPQWEGVKDTLQVMERVDPAAARHVGAEVLPRASTSLAANILAFLGAARDGDMNAWLGQRAVAAVRRTRPDLVERLRAEIAGVTKPGDTLQDGDWRTIPIPFATEQGLETLRMMVRHRCDDQPEDESKTGADASTRFVLDLRLSRLGRLQLDGLIRKEARRLDLLVRTERPLPPELRDGIRGVFAEAGGITGLGGTVGFQAAPAGFVEASDAQASAPGLVV